MIFDYQPLVWFSAVFFKKNTLSPFTFFSYRSLSIERGTKRSAQFQKNFFNLIKIIEQ
jgi:hypothetical protein